MNFWGTSSAERFWEVHKVEKEDKGAVFRGFLSLDEVKWEPLWLHKNELDPPEEILGQIENGQISLYGIKFKIEDMLLEGVTEEGGNAAGKDPRDSEEDGGQKIENNSVPEVCDSDLLEGVTEEGGNVA